MRNLLHNHSALVWVWTLNIRTHTAIIHFVVNIISWSCDTFYMSNAQLYIHSFINYVFSRFCVKKKNHIYKLTTVFKSTTVCLCCPLWTKRLHYNFIKWQKSHNWCTRGGWSLEARACCSVVSVHISHQSAAESSWSFSASHWLSGRSHWLRGDNEPVAMETPAFFKWKASSRTREPPSDPRGRDRKFFPLHFFDFDFGDKTWSVFLENTR